MWIVINNLYINLLNCFIARNCYLQKHNIKSYNLSFTLTKNVINVLNLLNVYIYLFCLLTKN